VAEKIEVKVTIEDKQWTIEGPADFVRAEAQRLTNMFASSVAVGTSAQTEGGIAASERELIALKKPSNHAETVAVLAYVLTKTGQPEFTAPDLRRAYARAGVRPPKVMDQSLRDAKNINDYLERGSVRGTFRLSPHGARTVEFDLPRTAPSDKKS
jgi:hypothetical protein